MSTANGSGHCVVWLLDMPMGLSLEDVFKSKQINSEREEIMYSVICLLPVFSFTTR